jgi:phytoene dehydrogenase-like protein
MHKLIFAVAFIGIAPIHVSAQNGWDDPFPAHRVMDNLYFVGTGAWVRF